jgi:hypothetical protein
MTGLRPATLTTVCVLSLFGLGAAARASDQPVVVELFTSQGCSSCPPANANLVRLAQRKDVLALSYSVTYWIGSAEGRLRQAGVHRASGDL